MHDPPRATNLLALLLTAALASSCAAAGGRCGNPPAGSVTAFFAGGERQRDAVATVASVTPLAEVGGYRYDMSDGARLTWIAEEPIPGLVPGVTRRIVVDHAPGSPDASGLLVFDGEQLLFAALADQELRQHVLREGLPHFTVSAGAASCRSRNRTRCHSAIVNLPVTFAHGGGSATLYQGENARLGSYEVRLLAAQQVTYASRCADAGLPGISFTIRRIAPQASPRAAPKRGARESALDSQEQPGLTARAERSPGPGSASCSPTSRTPCT